jgi:hypothetical protein
MASVTIDIPGVGNIEAKNAASEATLRELVNAIKGMKGGKGGGAGGKEEEDQAKDRKKWHKDSEKDQKEGHDGFKKLTAGIGGVVGGFFTLGGKLTDTVNMFAQLDGSVTDAAAIFSKLPIVGGLVGGAFTAVAGAADRVTKSFVNAAGGGASFGGSMSSFSASASAAGMNMAEFGSLVKNNGAGMMAFGTTTEDGAKNFAQVSKAVRSSSADLYALGLSTEEINGGLARYGALLRSQGLSGGKTNAQMAQGAKAYLKEMDGLAKITGEERSAKEAQAAALAKDSQFQAAMAGQNEEVQKSFRNTVLGLPGPLQNFTKDMLANGTATTEENQKLLAQLPESAAMLTQMQQKMQRGEAVTDAERNALNNKMKEEGARNLKNIKTAGAADASLSGVVNSLASTYQIAGDGVKKAGEQQSEAAKNTDKMNEKMQKFQQSLAELGNTFTMALASSGMLDVLMGAFKIVADLVTTYVLPAFMIFSEIVTQVGMYLIDNLKPVFESIGNFIRDNLYPAFLTLAAFILVDVVPVLESVGGIINDYVLPAFTAIAGFIWDNLMPIIEGLGAGFLAYGLILAAQAVAQAFNTVTTVSETGARVGLLAGLWAQISATWAAAAAALGLSAPMLGVVVAVAAVVAIFAALYKSGWSFGTAIDAVGDNLKRFWLTLVDAVNGLLSIIPNALGGISEEEAARRKASNDIVRAELDDKEKARDAERAVTAEGRNDKKERTAKEAEIDKKLTGLKDKHVKKLGDTNDKEVAAKEAALPKTDFGSSNSLDILKSEVAISEGPKSSPVAKAETAKKEMEAKADKDKSDKDAATKKEESKKEEGKRPAPAQETPETLLASLNTKLDQLIAVNKNMKEVQDRQLTVQQGLSGDLFASV